MRATPSWLVRASRGRLSRQRRGGPTVKQRITTFVASGVLALALFGEAMPGPLEDGEAAFQRGDYETAVRLWRLSGDDGNVDAQFNLGLLYSSGQGVPQDYPQAL